MREAVRVCGGCGKGIRQHRCGEGGGVSMGEGGGGGGVDEGWDVL